MRTKLPLLVAILVSFGARAADAPNAALQKGLFEEEANQNLDAAIAAYQSVLATHEEERKLAATALFRLGECYRKLGRTNDAVTQYQRLLRDYSEVGTLATLSRQNLTGLGANELVSRAAQTQAGRRSEPTPAQVEANRLLIERLELEIKSTQANLARQKELISQNLVPQNSSDEIEARVLDLRRQLILARDAGAASTVDATNASEARFQTFSPAARAQLKELLQSEIKIAEQFAAEQRKKVEAGTLAPGDQVRFERDVLGLKRQLIAADGLSSTQDRQQWRELLLEEIKLAEAAARFEKQKLDIGRSVASEVARLQRDVLILKRELVTFEATPIPMPSSGFQERLNEIVSRASPSNPPAPVDEEEKEIRRTQSLVKDSPDLVNALGTGGQRPLHIAASKGQLRVAEYLLANGADVNAASHYNNRPTGPTPLRVAAAAGHKKMVELLLSRGANIQGGGDSTALHDAAGKGYQSIVELLLANKADVNARNSYDATPLVSAVMNNHLAIARLLLANKAQTELKCRAYLAGADGVFRDCSGHYPLHIAVRARHGEMVELLLQSGANPDVRVDSKEPHDSPWATPLLLAVDYKLKSAILSLLKAKANPAIVGDKARTPLHEAVSTPDLLELLLANQVNPNLTNEFQATALHWAAADGALAAAEALLKHGANVNAADEKGGTPLHGAVRGFPEMVQLLLANQANVNARNNDGDTPLELARRFNMPARTTIMNLLLQNGAVADLARFDRIIVRRRATGAEAVVFHKASTNNWNHFTLLELIAAQYGLVTTSANGKSPGRKRDRADLFFMNQMNTAAALPFPDLARVMIRRPEPGGTQWKEIPVDLARLVRPDGGDCSGDAVLAWGDVVEIPELDHLADERWTGFDRATLTMLQQCLSRTIRVTVNGESATIKVVAPELEFSPGSYPSLVTYRRLMLMPVLRESRLLRNTSDLSRVTVTRRPVAGQPSRKWILDCSNSSPDLWLRDGDVIEVPEK